MRTKYLRGSEWRKWDLHIHTPETKKNDQFDGSTPSEKWDNYIKAINESTEDIAVIGITDYFCIDNYFKFKKLVEDKVITRSFELIIPNIEIRILPATASATPINIHCIFNPAIDTEIKTRFLSKLNFKYNGSDYSANELVRLGKALPGNSQLDDQAAAKAGIEQYVIGIDNLREVFEKDPKLRENTIIVVSNSSNDGASGIRKHTDFFISSNQTQLDATRYSIYQFSDAIFSSNDGDTLYFLGLGTDKKETVIEKCATIMPCFHGCDAHSNDKIFKPYENRFCWIKADPTFEGLKQTLYEPEDRVRIQALKPDVKNDRHVISELKYIDSGNLFGNQTILLNENLNSIIGGKSSGKSLLLYSAAKSIDPEQVERTSKRLGFEGYKFGQQAFDFEAIWKNGEKDSLNDPTNKNHKIIYIPQLYINYLVEKNNKEDLNNLVENILLQDSTFKEFYEQKKSEISNISVDMGTLLVSYLQIRTKALEIQQKLKDLGKSDAISKSAEKIQATITEGQKASNLSKEEFEAYNLLVAEKTAVDKQLTDLNEKELILSKISTEVNNSKANLLGRADTSDNIPIKGAIDRILDEMIVVPEDVITIKAKIESDFGLLITNLHSEIQKLNLASKRAEITKSIEITNEKLKPYLAKIAGQQELQKLIVQLEAEKQKMQQALNFEKQFNVLLADYKNTRGKIVAALKTRYSLYKEIKQKINDTKKDIGSEITLECDLFIRQEDLVLFNQVNKASISGENSFNLLFKDGYVHYEQLIKLFDNPLRVQENKLLIDTDGKQTISLKQKLTLDDILRGLITDSFKLDYTVTYKGDDLLNMSPGKKGTVLLILFLQISSSEYPILIDQPEDNLDNRTIYDLLCKMIKIKKKERQIIIVSHNANLVVATDSENIIVANQEGQDSLKETGRYRFEYINGSLEHSFTRDEKIAKVLHQQGIKEHVCDILEGGDEAFKQRERKYAIK